MQKPLKKSKLVNNETEVESKSSAVIQKSVMDTLIFQNFKNLTSEEENVRINAAVTLLQHLSKTSETEKRQKELLYTLKRLVRGCGASTNSSRCGFFTTLVAFLKNNPNEISNEEIFATIQKELNVGATLSNKEDADAVVGKMLICEAIIHSGRIAVISDEDLDKIVRILLQSTEHRTYHSSLGFSILIELSQATTEKQFSCVILPHLSKTFSKPWTKHTLQSVHCFIAMHKIFPSVLNEKFLKTHFGGNELLHAGSFQHLYKIFWQHNNTSILAHPAFEDFGTYIANNSKLSEFWKNTVDPGLKNPTKLIEIVTLRVIIEVLKNLDLKQTNIVDLLSENFMKMLIESLKNLKQKKDETLQAFYNEFFDALLISYVNISDDVHKTAVIKRLILPPGTFDIKKFTSTRFVNQLVNSLGESGVKDIFSLYKQIFVGTLSKNSENASQEWFNFERSIAGYMLQHLLSHNSVKSSYKWREEQLRFLLTSGVFYLNDEMIICKSEAAGLFSKNFGEQSKNMFYSSLQHKFTNMEQEKKLLFNLVDFCNNIMGKKNAYKYIRNNFTNIDFQKSWNNMYNEIALKSKNGKDKNNESTDTNCKEKLQIIFHILLLNMGLQYFREPEMAGPAIDDLIKCMHRIKEQHKHKVSIDTMKDEEPEWIEVVVDLFLHLLSQNTSTLRNIVNQLFPSLCNSLNLNTVHQILSMLDMKDEKNPLSAKGEEDDDDDDDDDEDEEEHSDQEEELDRKKKDVTESSADEQESNNDETESESDDEDAEEEEEDDEGSASGKLRNAISMALMENGALVGGDDDMDSVDLNDMTEEEGQKLDEALSNVFKAMKKSTGSSTQTKKSKSYRAKTTTVMHFRIRVLDLIEIYLQQKPTLFISIEIMLSLYNMLEFCIGEELKPLQNKVEKVLNKLTALKTITPDPDLSEQELANFIRLLVEKKTHALAFDFINKLRNKCIIFLIENKINVKADNSTAILKLCQEYIEEFIESRNPLITITLISDIMKLRWNQVWLLAKRLANLGVSINVRTFRRIQTYEILAVLYRNNILQKLDEDAAKKDFKYIEKLLCAHIKELAGTNIKKYSLKEFQTLLELILQVRKTHLRLQSESELLSNDICNLIQIIRRRIRLDSTQVYQRFCSTFKLQIIRNNEVNEINGDQLNQNGNGIADSDTENEIEKKAKTQVQSEQSNNIRNASKRKKRDNNSQKIKRQKKEKRLLEASKGLNGSTFV